MNQEEVKNIILKGVILEPERRKMIECFFANNEGITMDNVIERFHLWLQSDEAKKASSQIQKEKLLDEDQKIKIGMSSIDNEEYSIIESSHRFGMYVAVCNKTELRGLVTDDGKEVMPCIFRSVHIASGFLEVTFKGLHYSFSINPKDFANVLKEDYAETKDPETFEGYFVYADTETYMITHEFNRGANISIEEEMFNLLKQKHSFQL